MTFLVWVWIEGKQAETTGFMDEGEARAFMARKWKEIEYGLHGAEGSVLLYKLA